MINKNLKIALVCFAALFLISLVYLVFKFIFNIWPFNNEDFTQMSPCDDALTQVAIAQAAPQRSIPRSRRTGGGGGGEGEGEQGMGGGKNLCGLQGKKESYDFFPKSEISHNLPPVMR